MTVYCQESEKTLLCVVLKYLETDEPVWNQDTFELFKQTDADFDVERDMEVTEGRPSYKHRVRGHLSDLEKKGILRRHKSGYYKPTIKGMKRAVELYESSDEPEKFSEHIEQIKEKISEKKDRKGRRRKTIREIWGSSEENRESEKNA